MTITRFLLVFSVLAVAQPAAAQTDCMDLVGVDFGLCDMAMGVALVDGTCVGVSGCGWEVGGVDYSPYFYESIEACLVCDQETCVDSAYINPNMGCFALWDPVCGCNGQTYGNSCEAIYLGGVTSWTAGPCSDCIDPSLADPLVDCNPFDPEPVCGCDSLTHFSPCWATYMDWVTSFDEGACAGDCVDSTRMEPGFGCPEIAAPVCGCDAVTYGNACEAWYWGGVAAWTAGPCAGNAVGDFAPSHPDIDLWPNPSAGAFDIRAGGKPLENHVAWQLFSTGGQEVLSGNGSRVAAPRRIAPGVYFLKVQGQAPVRCVVE